MIKTLSLIKRRADLERSEFRDHYESIHAPLALPLMTGLVRYVRYHLEEEILGDVGFDVLSAFWYRDAEATKAIMAALAGEAGRAILEDELKFMDKAANTFFPVSERMLVEGEEGDEYLFVLIKKPDSMSRYDCSAKLVVEHWPRLLEAFEAVEFALLRDAFPMRLGAAREKGSTSEKGVADKIRYNTILQVRASCYAGLEDWSIGLGSLGYEITALRARRFETPL